MIVIIANFMNVLKDFPSRAGDRSVPAKVEDMGSIPGPGIPYVAEQLSPCTTTTQPTTL